MEFGKTAELVNTGKLGATGSFTSALGSEGLSRLGIELLRLETSGFFFVQLTDTSPIPATAINHNFTRMEPPTFAQAKVLELGRIFYNCNSLTKRLVLRTWLANDRNGRNGHKPSHGVQKRALANPTKKEKGGFNFYIETS